MGWFRHRRVIRIFLAVMLVLLVGAFVLNQQAGNDVFNVLNFDSKNDLVDEETDITPSVEAHDNDEIDSVKDFDNDFSDDLYETKQEASKKTEAVAHSNGKAAADSQSKASETKTQPKTPLDADHVSTLPSEFHVPKLEDPVPPPVVQRPPEMPPLHVVKPTGKYEKLLDKLPSEVQKYCHMPYFAPRGQDGEHLEGYRLVSNFQVISPGLTAPATPTDGQLGRLLRDALHDFDCSLDHADGSDKFPMSFGEFREFLKSHRNDDQLGEFVRTALRDDGSCDAGQLTPAGIVYHIELGELIARSLVERERLFNSPFADEESSEETKSDDESYKQGEDESNSKWLRDVRHAAHKSFRKRVFARALRSQSTVLAALATMYGLAKRLEVPSSWIRVEIIDNSERICEALVYNEEPNAPNKKQDDAQRFDCSCKARELYAEEAKRELDAHVRFAVHEEEERQFNRYRDLLAKLAIAPSQFEDAARVVLTSTCDQMEAGCYSLKKKEKDSEVCFKFEDIKRIIDANEYLEWKYSRERITLGQSVLSAYPYVFELAQRWTEVAGPETNYKLMDTAARSAKHADHGSKKTKARDFTALHLDFVTRDFLVDVRRTLNVSHAGTATQWVGYGQRMSFELYESLRRAPGEVLVRLLDADRELTQKSALMCPKTYGDGLCQLSRIHEYVYWDMVFDSTGVSDYNEICKPLKPIHVEL